MRTLAWPITPDEFHGVVRLLRFRYFKWDVYVGGQLRLLPHSIVLTPQEHAGFVDLAEKIAAALGRLETALRPQSDVLRALSIPRAVIRMIQCERPSPLQIARYDFFPTTDGRWLVSEFNEDVPGGFNETVAAADLLGEFHPGVRFVDRFAEAFVSALPDDGPIGLVYATAYAEDLQHMLVLEKLLADHGRPAVRCAPSHLTHQGGQPMVDQHRLAAAVRFFPGEWFANLPNQRAWRAVLPRLPMMNPLGRLIAQSKRVFALWNTPGVLDEADSAVLNAVAPATELFHKRHLEPLRRDPARWVLKASFGRMGNTVAMGRLLKPAEWEASLRAAQKDPGDHVVQECFDVEPLEFGTQRLYPAIGVYVINGRFAGYYSRVAEQPFLTHQASYVPTVVESV